MCSYLQAVFERLIESREREAEYNKKVAEKEWLDLMLFSRNLLTAIQEQLVLVSKQAQSNGISCVSNVHVSS